MMFDIPLGNWVKIIALMPIVISPLFLGVWFRAGFLGHIFRKLLFLTYFITAFGGGAFAQTILCGNGMGDARARDIHSTAFTIVFLIEMAISLTLTFLIVGLSLPKSRSTNEKQI